MMQSIVSPKAIGKDNVFTALEKAVRECCTQDCSPSFSGLVPAVQGDNQDRVLVVRLNRNCSWNPELLFKKICATESEQKGQELVFRGRLHGCDYTLRIISAEQDSKKKSTLTDNARSADRTGCGING